jgi:MFS family permease
MGGFINGKPWNDTFDNPDQTLVGTIVSILEVGAFFGSLFTAFVGEKLGRRKSILLGVVVMAIGSILQATAYSRAQIIVARVVAGIGLGINNSTVPVFQAEYSPKASRGLYVCMQLSTLNFGIMLIYWIDYAFSFHEQSFAWRVPTALQLVFLVAMLALALVVDETPRWLVAHDRSDEAWEVLQRVNYNRHTEEETRAQFDDIVNVVRVQNSIKTGSWATILKSDNISSRRRFFIACGIQFMQQAGGINAIVYVSHSST